MPRIKLTKKPLIQERLIDIKGQSISDLHLEGSFALDLRRNESFITYDSSEDAWYLQTSEAETSWVNVPVESLVINGYDFGGNISATLLATEIGIEPNIKYFSGKPVYFKYKASGSTVTIQYMFAIDLPEPPEVDPDDPFPVLPAPYDLTKIVIDLAAIDTSIFSAVNDSVGNYFLSTNVSEFQQTADHTQMCYYENNQLVFTCNNYTNGHTSLITQFNYDTLNAGLMYAPLKLVLSGTFVFERFIS